MSSEHATNPRPYWHVDAKWITGLLLVFVLGLTLLVYNLVQVTDEKPAIDTISKAIALTFSRKGLDDETEIVKLRRQLRASRDRSIQPIPGLRIMIREQDIANLSPRQVRLYIFSQLAEPLYKQGSQGLIALADDPEMEQKIAEGIGPLGTLTLKTHQTLQRALIALGIISSGLLIPLVFFSYGFGRLGSPGCILFVASLPGAIIFTIADRGLRNAATTTPPGEEAGITGMIGYLASNILPPMVRTISQNYTVFLTLGLGLMLIAILSNFIWRLTRKRRPAVGLL